MRNRCLHRVVDDVMQGDLHATRIQTGLTMRAPVGSIVLLLATAASAVSFDPGQRLATVDRVVEEAMESRGVPGVSIAIIDDFEIVHARGFGFAEPGRPVETDTLFQAASLTKPVSAVVAAAAAESGLVDLEADVSSMLTSWRLPPKPFDGPITLRMLFVHRAGTNVPGFPGYRLDEPLPDVPQILTGVREAASIVEADPGIAGAAGVEAFQARSMKQSPSTR